MYARSVALGLVMALALLGSGACGEDDPDKYRTIEEIIRSRGFDVEIHNVTTLDGYILTVHRLVNPKLNFGLPYGSRDAYYSYTVDRKPVIVQHGLFGSSADFLISSPFLYTNRSHAGDNLGFALHLTDRYDVWLSNSRGNRYSRGHRKYSDSDHAYWRFSFDQMAQYDLPAVVDYVRNATARKTVGYVGYSQGTASMFALLTIKPEYADIVRPVVALAPVSTVASIRSPARYLAPLGSILRTCGGEFLPSAAIMDRLSAFLCQNYINDKLICQNVVFLFSGYDPQHLNVTRIPVYFEFLPSTVSNWELAHWAQLVESKRFARFDYGSAEANRAAYGVSAVPDFPLEKIPSNAVIALFRGQNDYLSSVPDQERLIRILKRNGVRLVDCVVPEPRWTHIDFALGIDAGKLVYDQVIEVLDKYTE